MHIDISQHVKYLKINTLKAEEEMMTEVKVPYRLIFDGGVKMTEKELAQVTSLKEYLDEQEVDYKTDSM